MKYDRFMIAPLNTGLQTDVRPWLIPDDAFSLLNNAYVFRGRVRKRFGSLLMNGSVDPGVAQLNSRVRIQVDTTDGAGNAAGTVPGSTFKVGQLFSIGDEIFTVNALGAPAAMLKTGATVTATYNTTTGAYNFVGAALNTAVYFFPAEPIMGLITYETALINDEPTYAFDTQFAYTFAGGAWSRIGTAVWTGSNSQFFWGTTYRGINAYENFLFITNFNTPDQIKYWDSSTWTTINPQFNAAGDTIETTRIIEPFKDRLIFLNTVEKIGGNDRSFQNRCRFSQNGNPVAADAWREDIAGRGGYIDAPTKEAIISAEFLKDRLIVFFERSTWELVYTGNEILPFRWQQINTELGAESTFSRVPFDKVILGVGNVGIHACNGSNVERIDHKIDDAVFEIHNENEGVFRVQGIRDYTVEMVYWTFPSADKDTEFSDRVLTYDYVSGSWSFNDDSITAFGYFQNQSDITWESVNKTWAESVERWNSGTLQSQFRQVLAGNQEGFVFIVDPETTRNAPALQITDMTFVGNLVTLSVQDHNLSTEDFIVIENAQGITSLNDNVYQVNTVVDSNTITVLQVGVSGTYTGGGTIGRVSRIDIKTKQYNFYLKEGRNAYVSKVDFFVTKTSEGSITIDSFPSSSEVSLTEEGQATGALLGTNILETSPYSTVPLENAQSRVWHPVYLQSEGETIQLRIYLSDDQLQDTSIAWSDFQLNAMTFYAMPTADRLE